MYFGLVETTQLHIMIKNASSQEFIQKIKAGNLSYLSRAITLIESEQPAHYEKASEILNGCLKHEHQSVRIGITGVPGVGKSTFIEAFGKLLTAKGHKVAVLTIDPSSVKSKGSILGDKTRMESLANDPNAFIRPSPSGATLGGVAKKTRETIRLCEAAGYRYILIETVGVGQSETEVSQMVDFFLLLKLANAGDELQGIKRGIIEMADLIVINKADGKFEAPAKLAKTEFERSLHLFPPKESNWIPKVCTSSALKNKGISKIAAIIEQYIQITSQNGYLLMHRKQQNKNWFFDIVDNSLKMQFYNNKEVEKEVEHLLLQIENKDITPNKAAQYLLRRSS